MAYGPLKLCGTESTVWAVDGTSAIGYSVFVVESRVPKAYQRPSMPKY